VINRLASCTSFPLLEPHLTCPYLLYVTFRCRKLTSCELEVLSTGLSQLQLLSLSHNLLTDTQVISFALHDLQCMCTRARAYTHTYTCTHTNTHTHTHKHTHTHTHTHIHTPQHKHKHKKTPTRRLKHACNTGPRVPAAAVLFELEPQQCEQLGGSEQLRESEGAVRSKQQSQRFDSVVRTGQPHYPVHLQQCR